MQCVAAVSFVLQYRYIKGEMFLSPVLLEMAQEIYVACLWFLEKNTWIQEAASHKNLDEVTDGGHTQFVLLATCFCGDDTK
jgi:hypothetical protein